MTEEVRRCSQQYPTQFNPQNTEISSLGQRVVVIGGLSREKRLNSAILYDTKDKIWTSGQTCGCVRNMPWARSAFGSVLLNDRIYVVGGRVDDELHTNSTLIYSISDQKWTEGPLLNDKRSGLALVAVRGGIVALGGVGEHKKGLTSCERLFSENNIWTQLPAMHMERHALCGVELNGLIYAIGGEQKATVEVLDSFRGKWKMIAPMNCVRLYATASVLCGKILVIGGERENSAEVYNPQTQQWQLIAPMSSWRYCACSVSVDNKVLVFGGWDEYRNTLCTVEEYDPRTNKWTVLKTKLPYGLTNARAFILPSPTTKSPGDSLRICSDQNVKQPCIVRNSNPVLKNPFC